MLVYGKIEMAKKIFYQNPYLTTLVVLGFFTFFEIAFFARAVFAQKPGETESFDIFKTVQLISTLGVIIGFVAAFVWYVVKGKSNDQLTKNNQDLKLSNDELRAQNAEFKVELSEMRADIKELEDINEELRKANLRLQGINKR
jgi:cell shape-determining protein MreC